MLNSAIRVTGKVDKEMIKIRESPKNNKIKFFTFIYLTRISEIKLSVLWLRNIFLAQKIVNAYIN